MVGFADALWLVFACTCWFDCLLVWFLVVGLRCYSLICVVRVFVVVVCDFVPVALGVAWIWTLIVLLCCLLWVYWILLLCLLLLACVLALR